MSTQVIKRFTKSQPKIAATKQLPSVGSDLLTSELSIPRKENYLLLDIIYFDLLKAFNTNVANFFWVMKTRMIKFLQKFAHTQNNT